MQKNLLSLPDQLEKVVVGISLGVGHLAGLDNSRTKACCICSRYIFYIFVWLIMPYIVLPLSWRLLDID